MANTNDNSDGWQTVTSRRNPFPAAFRGKRSSEFGGNARHGYSSSRPPRSAQEEPKTEEDKMAMNEINFPSLGGGAGWGSSAAPSAAKNFASMAEDWKARDEESKQRAERAALKKAMEESDRARLRMISTFGARSSRREDTYEEDEYYEDDPPYAPVSPSAAAGGDLDDGGGWTLVERRAYRPPKPKVAPAPAPREETERDETVWDDGDYRDPRERDSIW